MSKNKASIGDRSWFNSIKQGVNEGGDKVSFWKIAGGVLAALAAIAGVIGILISLGIISVNK